MLEQRIHRAKKLMMKESKSISHAAHLAGFANHSHFTKSFPMCNWNHSWSVVARCRTKVGQTSVTFLRRVIAFSGKARLYWTTATARKSV
ncbi:hypothetical protein [Edaphobacter aggregans]|uniref:hypothetical protein n=1 Tax=Edaphobacter aggregans TaxID=570835 RepID=UPI003CCBE611